MSPKEVTFKLQCTFADCSVVVEGYGKDQNEAHEKANSRLRKHKARSNEHDYCKKCDLDFECYDDFVKHKAESSDRVHISCPWCGQDFGSHDGRNTHIAQNHPKEQNITCPGCGERFGRTAAFIFHLEKGYCKSVSVGEFESHVRHKHFTHKALQDPASAGKWDTKNEQERAAEDVEGTGGVMLDLDDHLESTHLQAPLEPEKKDFKVGPNVVEHFPPLPSSRLPIEHSRSTSKYAQFGTRSEDENEGQGRDCSYHTAAMGETNPAAWSTANELVGTFTDSASPRTTVVAKKMPWDDKFNTKTVEDDGSNMMREISIANPDHTAFDAEKFFNHITETYDCPWAGCHESYTATPDLRHHLQYEHEAANIKCPLCQKKFEHIHSLISHCEAVNGRCKVKHIRGYGEFINRITGGFINVSIKERDDLEFKQSVIMWDGSEKTNIVRTSYTEYASQAPKGLQIMQPKDGGTGRLQGAADASHDETGVHGWLQFQKR